MKKSRITIIVGILTIATIGVCGYNLFTRPCAFLEASATQALTLLVALYIAFWANQYKNDQRKAKSHAERILQKLQQLVTDDSFSVIPTDGNGAEIQKRINMQNRKISNYLRILKEYAEALNFNKEIGYIDTNFQDYKAKVSEHIQDLEYLAKTESEFRRIAENIDSKCEDIILLFYK